MKCSNGQVTIDECGDVKVGNTTYRIIALIDIALRNGFEYNGFDRTGEVEFIATENAIYSSLFLDMGVPDPRIQTLH